MTVTLALKNPSKTTKVAIMFSYYPLSSLIIPLSIGILAIIVINALQRPPFPKGAPKRTSEEWPIVGSLRFFSQHRDFNLRGIAQNASQHFSFYLGKHQVVSIGADGRKTYFESNGLNAGEGYATLFTGTPHRQSAGDKELDDGQYQSQFGKTIIQLLKKSYLSQRVPTLSTDVKHAMESLIIRASSSGAVMKPFEEIYSIVWKQTNRLVGADEIANSPQLLKHVLDLFEDIGEGASPFRVIFPMLPTLDHIKRMVAGARLYGVLKRIVDSRKSAGNRKNDALQFLIDKGENLEGITGFIAGGLFAGQLNTGVNASWLLVYLATHPKWYKQVQREVDDAILRRRTVGGIQRDQVIDILMSLDLAEWTKEFPIIDYCLKETIRFQLPGTFCRKNTSGRDIPISGSNEIIPKNAYAVYLTDNSHFNSQIYSNPLEWDPSRYMDVDAKYKQTPYSYVGWGVGRHSCLGMTAAQVEITMVIAYFISIFDFYLLDENGKQTCKVPIPERNRFGAGKPHNWDPSLRYELRSSDIVQVDKE